MHFGGTLLGEGKTDSAPLPHVNVTDMFYSLDTLF